MATIILGGGVSGLLTAWHLHRRGEAVEVWEAEAEAGGWVQTLPWNGPGGEPGRGTRRYSGRGLPSGPMRKRNPASTSGLSSLEGRPSGAVIASNTAPSGWKVHHCTFG